ncbi:O-antigen ligase family protein [Priestia megaterium]
MDLLFLVKPVIDMLWKYKIFDIFLLLLLLVYIVPRFFYIKISVTSVLLITFMLFLFRSYIVKIDMQTTLVFLKILSAILMFFAAQFNRDIEKTLKYISLSYIVPIICYIIFAVTHKGFIYWGAVKTFVGPYYYKTDLAIAVIISIIFIRRYLFFSKIKYVMWFTRIYIFLLAPIFILLANSRMMTIIYGIFFVVLIVESYQYKVMKVNSIQGRLETKVKRNALVVLSLIIVTLGYTVYDTQFKSENALAISINEGQIFSLENTQGRSGIWETTIGNFLDGNPFSLLLGYYINKEFELNTYSGQDAHNTYLKLLVTTGFIGGSLYIFFNGFILRRIKFLYKKIGSSSMNYFTLNTILMITLFFIISGFTQSNIIYTQSSWYAFYFMGLLYNPNLFNK